MDKATGPAQPVPAEQRRGRGKVRPRVSIEERVLPIAAPAGSRFKGYEPYLVQELVLSVQGLVLSVQAVRYPVFRNSPMSSESLLPGSIDKSR